MINCRVDRRGLLAYHNRLRAALPMARVRFVQEMARLTVHTAAAISPRDTGRYVRGWVLAGRGAGVVDLTIPRVIPSRYAEQYLEHLEMQVRRLEASVARVQRLILWWYERPGRRGSGYYNKLLAQEQRQIDRLQSAQRQLQDFIDHRLKGALVIGVRAFAGGKSFVVPTGSRKTAADRVHVTVRHKLYGGRGRIVHGPNRSVILLQNLEPHAGIIERRYRVMSRAVAVSRRYGLRPIASAMVRGLATTAGVGGRPGVIGRAIKIGSF